MSQEDVTLFALLNQPSLLRHLTSFKDDPHHEMTNDIMILGWLHSAKTAPVSRAYDCDRNGTSTNMFRQFGGICHVVVKWFT